MKKNVGRERVKSGTGSNSDGKFSGKMGNCKNGSIAQT